MAPPVPRSPKAVTAIRVARIARATHRFAPLLRWRRAGAAGARTRGVRAETRRFAGGAAARRRAERRLLRVATIRRDLQDDYYDVVLRRLAAVYRRPSASAPW